MGHLIAPEGDAADLLRAEIAAWEWALSSLVIQPTADAATAALRALGSYVGAGAALDPGLAERLRTVLNQMHTIRTNALRDGRLHDPGALDVDGRLTGRVRRGQVVADTRWF